MSFIVPAFEGFPKFLKSIESKWKIKLMRRFDRERWVGSKEELAATGLPRYVLSMFPYPSGNLHLGHVRIYTSGDILARYSRLRANNKDNPNNYSHVINPMGFDSFGLPAENAARERGLDPAKWTNSNIRTMKQQLDDLALQFDWREATSNPSYYKWTQHLFLQLFDAGLAYKSYSKVNWDPIDKTVLADEQVDDEGRSWRSGALVEKRDCKQWFIKVNAFTNDIYNATDVDPDSWQDILNIQRNWIGKPCGWIFYLPVRSPNSSHEDIVPIFTKMPELFLTQGAKLVISSDHWLESIYKISKIGSIKNPFSNGALGVQLTDEVDKLPESCKATLVGPKHDIDSLETVDSYGSPTRDQVILQAKLNGLGGYYTSDKYRDWLISRQRFWGTPIPVVSCDSCGYKGVEREHLPVTLPSITDLSLSKQTSSEDVHPGRISSPIEELASKEWLETKCPSCHSAARRECETVDTLFDSSWYFLRYSSSPLSDKPFDQERVQPVWCYIGGKEHASMHLFYARFITHFLHSQGQIHFKEPFAKLLVQGIVKSKTYKLDGRYLSPSEVEQISDTSGLTVDYEKMSKSKGNGVDPQKLIEFYGADATRFCLMSYANPKTERLWRSTDEEFREVIIYMRRVALIIQEYLEIGNILRSGSNQKKLKLTELTSEELESNKKSLVYARNRHCIDAMYNIQETNQFRQYISVLQSLTNVIKANMKNSMVYTKEFAETLAAMIIMLNPIAPHFSEELWANFSQCVVNPLKSDETSPYQTGLQAADQPWPIADKDHPLQIKIRDITADAYADKITISQDQFRTSSENDLANLVGDHFKSNGDKCEILEVKKFDDLMAIVVAKIESIQNRAQKKKSKKRSV